MTFKIPQRHNGRQSARGIVLGIYPNDGDGLYYPCLQEGRRHVRCHEGVARWLVTCVLLMLRGKAKNQNIIFFYTRNHELSSGPALKDVHAMPEPRWNRAAMKGALVVVGGVRRLLEAIFRSIGRETSDLAVNPEWKRLASERCGAGNERPATEQAALEAHVYG